MWVGRQARILTINHWFREAKPRLIHEALLLLLASVFVFISAVALSLASDGGLQWSHLYAPIGWFAIVIIAFFALHRSQPQHDPYLFPLVALMSGWGLILIDRLAPNFLNRQLIWTGVGIFALLLSANIPRDLGWLYRYRYTWLLAGILLLAATIWFGVNPSGQGATLWLKVPLLGNVFFQPSELLKLLLVIFLASYFDDRSKMLAVRIGNGLRPALAYLAPLIFMWGFCLVLLVWQQDLGAATLFFTVFLVLLYLATGKWQYILLGIILLLIAGLIGYFAFDLVALRIDTWLNPWIEADSRGFQIVQSLYAVASGGIFGQGVSQGYPTFIPVVHSDFAFAAIAEEWGLVGALTILCCFAVLAYRGIRIASRSRRLFNLFLATGITVVLCTQALLIMAGVTKILPLTGVTLPFVSYGGSSFVMSSLMIGLLLNLSTRQSEGQQVVLGAGIR
jgi:cell division protein FtsW (lipid II flippase)